VPGGIEVYNPIIDGDTPLCCPAEYEHAVWVWRDGTFARVSVRTVPTEQVPDG
jgi:hypothetical protein